MLSFHNDKSIKELYVNRVKLHQLADEIEQGFYWENGRGCAVGCTIHGEDHSSYERELGIPKVLSKIEDCIFENLPVEIAKLWPLKFLETINVGVDLSSVWPKFSIWLLTDEIYGVLKYVKLQKSIDAILSVSEGYKNYLLMTEEKWNLIIENTSDAYDSANDDRHAHYAHYAVGPYYRFFDEEVDSISSAHYAAWAARYPGNPFHVDHAAQSHKRATTLAIYGNDESKHIIAQSEKLLELLRDAV